jgi:hypothetical protein
LDAQKVIANARQTARSAVPAPKIVFRVLCTAVLILCNYARSVFVLMLAPSWDAFQLPLKTFQKRDNAPRRLLLGAERPVLQAHLVAVAFPASRRGNRVLATAPKANLEVQPAVLRDLFLCCVCYRHVVHLHSNEG